MGGFWERRAKTCRYHCNACSPSQDPHEPVEGRKICYPAQQHSRFRNNTEKRPKGGNSARGGKSGFEPSSTNTEVQPQIARETANQEAKKDTFLLLNAHFSYCVFTKNQISLPSRTPEVQIPISLAACRVPTVVAAQRDARRPSPLWRARPH